MVHVRFYAVRLELGLSFGKGSYDNLQPALWGEDEAARRVILRGKGLRSDLNTVLTQYCQGQR
jgi:hypothetical protein